MSAIVELPTIVGGEPSGSSNTAPPNTDSDTGTGDGPSSLMGIGPPSPLTGCYLLIIIGEPHSHGHKDIILQRLLKGMIYI